MKLERDGELSPPAKAGLGAVLGAGVLGLVLYAAASDDWAGVLGGGLMAAAAFTVAGGLLGFLFGIPRLLTSGAAAHPDDRTATSTASYAPNTNLEQVSDWLTKILLGAGLTQIGTVPHRLRQLGNTLAPLVGDGSGAPAFAAALSVYFSILGFLVGWLLTRLLAARALSAADRQTLADSVTQTLLRAKTVGYEKTDVQKMFDTKVEGLRVQALALMQGNPDRDHFSRIIDAIDHHNSPFELLQSLLAALATIGTLEPAEKLKLREAVEYKLRNARTMPTYSRRRSVAEEILKALPKPDTAAPATPGPASAG